MNPKSARPQSPLPNPHSAFRIPQFFSPTVFVVDDDPSVRRALSRLLRSAGYNVETFASAREFLDRVSVDGGFRIPDVELKTPHGPQMPNPQSNAGCLVLDVQMPGLSGPDLQEALGGPERSMPIIFITGHGSIPMSVRAMKKGAVDFLTKPFDDRDLLAAIAVALARDKEARDRRARTGEIQNRIATLTPRERDVMRLVVLGRLNKQIAAELGIAEKTVKVHRGRVMTKMGAGSVAELVRLSANAEGGTRNAEE